MIAAIQLLAVLLLAPMGMGQSPEGRLETLAGEALRYVQVLFEQDPAALDPFHDAAMKAAMSPEKVEQILASIEPQLGALTGMGEPWHEGTISGYDQFRVPLDFEKGEVDARVVFEPANKVAGLQFLPRLEPPSEDVLEAPGEEREVEVGTQEARLPGVLLVPEGEGPFPGVVLVHGSGPNDRDETIGPNKPFRDLAWGLAEKGIASLRYDKRSLARPDSLVSLGDDLTVEEEVIVDARRALKVLGAAPEVDASRTYLIGHSLGGAVLPRIPDGTTPVAGLIVMAGPTLPFPEKIVEQTEYVASLAPALDDAQEQQVEAVRQQMKTVRDAIEGKIEAPSGYFMGAPIGYYADLEAHPPEQTAARIQLPILVLQGERDYQVTMGDFALWQDALDGKEFACLKSYPALDHLFHEGSGPSTPADYQARLPVANIVISDIAAWILEGQCGA